MDFTAELIEFLQNPDPRVKAWPLMNSPYSTVGLVIFYLVFVKVLGPAWMKDRKPFDLRFPMIVYNFCQVGISLWIFINLGKLGWFNKYNWRCEPIDFSYNYEAVRIAEVFWICYLVKFLEFFDTVFFVLRKKNSHVSVLHVFHHALVPITAWIGIKYGAGGYNSLFPFLNSFIHVWTYAYYGLSALGPTVQKYLWWKKYLTELQMVQFVIVLIYMAQLYLYPTCTVSRPLLTINLFIAAIFFAMFWNFYSVTYTQTSSRAVYKKR